jgi:hypothetical protein
MALGKKSKAAPFNINVIFEAAKSNPYVQQLANDAKLRKNLQTAVASGRRAYGRVSSNGTLIDPRSLLEDKRLHSDVGRALGAARDATITMTHAQRKRRRRGLTVGRVLILGAVGTGIAVATSEKLRSKVLDMLFGAEEEFQYTPPPNSSSSEAGATVGAA